MIIIGIDPGSKESGIAALDTETHCCLPGTGIHENEALAVLLGTMGRSALTPRILAVETTGLIHGMPAWDEVLQEMRWGGIFTGVWMASVIGEHYAYDRRKIKAYILGRAYGKDSEVHQCLSARWGGTRKITHGTVKAPGPLYGVKEDAWQALAVAVYHAETVLGVKPEKWREG